MFSFEQFPVYVRAQQFHTAIHIHILKESTIDYVIKDQLNRAALSICLNIAEGSGRHSSGEKRHFYLIARGSVHECVAIIKTLSTLRLIPDDFYNTCYLALTEISKMLSGLIKKFDSTQ